MRQWSRGVTLAAVLVGAGLAVRGMAAQQAGQQQPEITVYKSPT